MTICPQVDSKHGGELCERELHGDSISHCAQHRTNGRQRPARNLGRAADYAGDCYCNPLTDPYALRDCYYALSRLLLPPVASRWPLDFWQCRGDSPPIAHLAGTGAHSTGMVHTRAHSAGHLRHWYGVGRCGCSQDLGGHTRHTAEPASWHNVWQPQRPAAQPFWAKAGRLVTPQRHPLWHSSHSGPSPLILAHSYIARMHAYA